VAPLHHDIGPNVSTGIAMEVQQFRHLHPVEEIRPREDDHIDTKSE
jgi:hypothetical protein